MNVIEHILAATRDQLARTGNLLINLSLQKAKTYARRYVAS